MTADTELEQQLAYLATELLGQPALFYVRPGGGNSLLTGNGTLEIIEAMRHYGYELWRDRKTMWFWHADDPDGFLAYAVPFSESTPWPETVARAACAALKTHAELTDT